MLPLVVEGITIWRAHEHWSLLRDGQALVELAWHSVDIPRHGTHHFHQIRAGDFLLALC